MLDSCLLKQLLSSELSQGKYTVGEQKKLFRDCPRAPSKTLIVPIGRHFVLTTQPAARSSKEPEQQLTSPTTLSLTEKIVVSLTQEEHIPGLYILNLDVGTIG